MDTINVKNTFYAKYGKRIFDVTCCLIALVLFWWLFLILAIVVRFNMGSPVIFVHRRPGKIDPATGKSKVFNLCKFRSMTNAVDENGVLLPNKDRLTKFGRILRSTSLDELPEIWNVLKGEMSLVGPRPLVEKYLNYYTPREYQRHLVRPGLTGWAQVNGRTALSWEKRFELDLYYVENVSLWLDLKILFMTAMKLQRRSDIVEAGKQGNFYDYRERQWANGEVPRPDNGEV